MLFLSCPWNYARANLSSTLIDQAHQKHLSQDRVWQQLLHYDRGQSVVTSDEFFLSPQGRIDPQAELDAALREYFAPWAQDGNTHARCRFPARYYWLAQQLPLPGYQLRDQRCGSFEKWALLDHVESVSVLMVSGFFGNPASTFGHTLLKFNRKAASGEGELFDVTLGYGALVPENENGILYVVRGLFGGYKAGFSDRYFYTQDVMYRHTEFRDMWEYELSLSEEQETLLVLHIWEIVQKKFNYYFLLRNCAYRLAEFLEMVTGTTLTDVGLPWYLPRELFDQLERERLIKSIKYIPSNQRVLYYQLSGLSSGELGILNRIIRKGGGVIKGELSGLNEDRQIAMLETLMAYHQYRLVADGPVPRRNRENLKNDILLARLRLPAKERPSIKLKELAPPTEGSRPMTFSAGVASGRHNKPFLRLNWTGFNLETVGQNSLDGDEFVLMDTAVGVLEDGRRAFVDRVELLRILKLNSLYVPVVDESPWSWEVRAGMNRVEPEDEGRYDGSALFGLGRAGKVSDALIVYGMLDMAGHTIAPYGRLRPYLGARCDLGRFKALTFGGAETKDYAGNVRPVWGGKLQYQINKGHSIHVDVSNDRATRGVVSLNWYW